MTTYREEAAECIRNCLLSVQCAEELLMQRHMGKSYPLNKDLPDTCSLLFPPTPSLSSALYTARSNFAADFNLT